MSVEGKALRPAQGNKAYVFPLFLTAARALARLVRQSDLDEGAIYPPLTQIRKISLAIAVSAASEAYALNLARERRPRNLRASIQKLMYRP